GVFIFAYDAMKKFGLSQKMLPAGSVIRNRPESIYDRYHTQVWAVTIVFIALIAFIIVLAYNVFRRKKVEEDRERLVSAIEEADDMFCFSSVDETVLYMNAAGMKTLGWKPEEIEKGLKSLEYIHPDHVTEKLHDVIYHELMKSGKWKGESAICAADGREIPVSQVITMHQDENGKPQYFSSIIRDISEQKRNEEVLRSSEENLRITLDSIGDAVIATDDKGVVRRINPAAEKITGCSCDDAVGKKLSDVFRIVSASDGSEVENPVEAVLRSGSTVFMQDRKTVLISSDGTRRMIADSAAPIRDTENRVVGVVLVFHDMTEEYSIQDQLRRAQRMEVIGQLAGGVAHDFNNILAVILGTAQILEHGLPQKSDDRALAEDIVGAAIRASELTRQLLAFSRKGKMQMVEIHLHDIVREVGRLLERSIDKSIKIVENLEAPSDVIMGDPSLIQSAILNLAVNARDAMPKGGELSFESGIVSLNENDCATQGVEIEPGKYISLSVTDNGEGMSEETRNRLFEPYFTTKPEGKGTGLGLAAVYGCVRSHHGCIQVQSELGKGSVFRLLFPLSSSETGNCPVESEGAVHGSGTILVVDDEDIVRNMTVKALNALGYRAVDASDGYAAMSRLKDLGGDVGLVILDIVMPVIGGRETFHMMKKEYPDLKILLCSGFTRHGVTDELLKAGAAGFIAKPFRIDELSRKVAALMSKSLTV
ncbi:MAG TPA: PAS domain S-box protein, partial [Spirochaetota bacterium]|nr:PAS domain S-box protein [Spirochaetota bacterium]